MSESEQSKPRVRDADRTKARIFAVAVEEFSAKGFDGARIDRIADIAGVNKRMIYIYWGDKRALYHEILKRKVLAMHEVFTGEWGTPAENLLRYFRGTGEEIELLRFVQWEALSDPSLDLVAEDERREAFRIKVETLRRDQLGGQLRSDVPAEYLMLLFMALACFPMAFPQNTKLVTGLAWDDPAFEQAWEGTLRAVGEMLAPPSTR